METVTPTENTPARKRVVFVDRDGLYTIVGLFDPSVHTLRPVISVQRYAQMVEASLWRVMPRLVIYRQNMPEPAMGRLGEFHPEQR